MGSVPIRSLTTSSKHGLLCPISNACQPINNACQPFVAVYGSNIHLVSLQRVESFSNERCGMWEVYGAPRNRDSERRERVESESACRCKCHIRYMLSLAHSHNKAELYVPAMALSALLGVCSGRGGNVRQHPCCRACRRAAQQHPGRPRARQCCRGHTTQQRTPLCDDDESVQFCVYARARTRVGGRKGGGRQLDQSSACDGSAHCGPGLARCETTMTVNYRSSITE